MIGTKKWMSILTAILLISSMMIPIFGYAKPASAQSPSYQITITETGLPAGTTWTATIQCVTYFQSYDSTASSQVFNGVPGATNCSWSVSASNYQASPSGESNISFNSDQTIPVSFSGGSSTGPTTGSLSVTLTGLPSTSSAEIYTTGPSGYNNLQTVAGGQTISLSNLAPGTYTVQPGLTAGYQPAQGSYAISVVAGQTATVTIPYTTTGSSGGTSSDSVGLSTACINGLQVDLNGGASPGSSVTSISWNWGDGSTTSGFFPESHTYSSGGTYAIKVTANYNDGSSASASQTVNVAQGTIANCDELTINAGTGGSISYSASVGSGTVQTDTSKQLYLDYADDLNLVASPSNGYSFSSWTTSGTVTGFGSQPVSQTPNTSIVVGSNGQISAVFTSTTGGSQLDTTATTVSLNPATVFFSQQTTVTATVKDTTSNTNPTGIVTFSDPYGGIFNPSSCNLAPIGSSESQCEVQYTEKIGGGKDTLTATYVGNSKFASSQGSLPLMVLPTSLSLSPLTATTPLGSSYTVTATIVTQGLILGANVDFTVTGANTASGSCTTTTTDQCSFTYTGKNAGTDTITGQITNIYEPGLPPSETVSNIWTGTSVPTVTSIQISANPTTIIANNDQSTITATVLDQNGNPMSNIPLTLLSTAGSLIQQSFTTNSQGQVMATLSYAGTVESPITVTITGQVNGVKGTAQVTVFTPTLKILDYSVSNMVVDYVPSSFSTSLDCTNEPVISSTTICNPTSLPTIQVSSSNCNSGDITQCEDNLSLGSQVVEAGVEGVHQGGSPNKFTVSIDVENKGLSDMSLPALIPTDANPSTDARGASIGTNDLGCTISPTDPTSIPANMRISLQYNCNLFSWGYATQLNSWDTVLNGFIRGVPYAGGIIADLLANNDFIPQVNYTMSLVSPNQQNVVIDTSSMTTASFLGTPHSIKIPVIAPSDKISESYQYIQFRLSGLTDYVQDQTVSVILAGACVVTAIPSLGFGCVPESLWIAYNAIKGAYNEQQYQAEIADPSLNYTQLVQVKSPSPLLSSLQNTTAGKSLYYLSLYKNYLDASVQSNLRAYGALANNSTYYAYLQDVQAERFASDASMYYNQSTNLLNQTLLQLNGSGVLNQNTFNDGQEYLQKYGLPSNVNTILKALNLTNDVNVTEFATAKYISTNVTNLLLPQDISTGLVNDDRLYLNQLSSNTSLVPNIHIDTPIENFFSNHKIIEVSGTTEDVGGIQKVSLSIDGNQSSPAMLNFGAYSNSTASWTYVTPPLADGSHVIIANSTANNGLSSLTSVLVTIDTISPEAYIQFDPTTTNIILYGTDNLSGISGNPISPVSTVPAKWGDDNKFDHDTDKGDAQTRTYDIVDRAGNTLVLVEKIRTNGHETKASIQSLQYNNGKIISVLPNEEKFDWSVAKNGSIQEIDQHVTIGKDKNKQDVSAKYSLKDNTTVIEIHGKPDHRKITEKGLVLLQVASNQGNLFVNGY